MIRPPRTWDAGLVPWLTPWSSEQIPAQPVTWAVGPRGAFLGLHDEAPADRHLGVLWLRMPATPGAGRPEFAGAHALRQRTAMTRLLCQMCGGTTIDSRDDGRVLMLMAAAGGRPISCGERTSSPPIHAHCARLAVQHCPPLRRRGWVAALVDHTAMPIWGYAGLVYDPVTLQQTSPANGSTHEVPAEDEGRLRWLQASRMLVTLEDVEPVTDLGALTDLQPSPATANQGAG